MSGRDYERRERVGELLREILAVEIDRLDDDRLFGTVVTGVDVEKAVVFVDADDGDGTLTALEEHAGALRRAVSRNARLRRTPRLEFQVDGSVSGGNRIEEILAGLEIPPDDADVAGDQSAAPESGHIDGDA